MLVLTRKISESIQIGDEISITVLSVQGQNVKIGISAPREVTVHRKEIYERIVVENRRAALSTTLENAEKILRLGAFGDGGNGK